MPVSFDRFPTFQTYDLLALREATGSLDSPVVTWEESIARIIVLGCLGFEALLSFGGL